MIRLVIPLVILVAGAIGYKVLSVKPEPPPAGKSAPKPLRTRVMPLEKGDYPVIIQTQGVVRSHNEVTLTSQVTGRIQTISPEFQVGAFFTEGDILLELDPVDFEVAVVSAEAQLARAETVFAQEQTRARQAKRNWEDLGYEEEPNELVLRLPQLKEAEINVQSAQAQLESARRNLERSRVRAPFDGRVLTRQIGVGQTINGSTPLGTVFATDYAEVRLPLSATDLRFLDLPEKPDDEPLKVELRDALDPAATGVREAMITRTEGALDENTLELFVIARIEDPFGVESGSIPLRIGQPVVAEIQGNTVKDAFKVPRSAVFELNKIIVIDPETMELSNKVIQILYGTEDELLIEDPGISPGALLATTRLVYAPEGAKVQIITKSLSEVPLQGAVSTNKTTKPAAGGGQGGTD
jgi:RND family efflux transporter MFP subunit